MGLTAGAIGAFCGTPADVALIRMCVDNRLPEAERRNYKSVFDAWRRIAGEEGITALWTGCGPTIGRAMVVNVCQLCCQTQAKQEIGSRTGSMIELGCQSNNCEIKFPMDIYYHSLAQWWPVLSQHAVRCLLILLKLGHRT